MSGTATMEEKFQPLTVVLHPTWIPVCVPPAGAFLIQLPGNEHKKAVE